MNKYKSRPIQSKLSQSPKFLFITHLFTKEKKEILNEYRPGLKLSENSWSKCIPLNRKAKHIQNKLEGLNERKGSFPKMYESKEKSIEKQQGERRKN